jgi:translocation-and-assembly-module (TAM) inner membrane subunit TamB-like protein
VKFFKKFRAHRIVRYTGTTAMVAVAILAAGVVSTLTVDLGPAARGFAEREGSKALKRPIHIGALSIHVLSGKFIVQDFSIGGLEATHRPFFTAKRLALALDWSTAVRRRPVFTVTSVELTDWEMLVEKWSDGHNFPKFSRDRDPDEPADPNGPRVKATMQYLRAWRGRFAYEDHGAPWSIVAPNIDMTITNLPRYHGEATFHGGTIAIQDHVPMWANFKARFDIDGSRLHMRQIEFETDGAHSAAVGEVDLSRWPEMTYDVKSRVDFQRMREVFFQKERWALSGEGNFTGKFHLFKGGHDLAGNFTSKMAGVYDYHFPSLYGSLHWTPRLFEVTEAGSQLYGGDARFAFSMKPLGTPERATARFDASYENVDLAQITDFYELAGVRFAGRISGDNTLEWPVGAFRDNRGAGHVSALPPPGVRPMSAALGAVDDDALDEWGPFAPAPLPRYVPIAGDVSYRLDPDRIVVEEGRFITEQTHVAFEGSTAWGEASRFHFHVVSNDWQESDSVLAGILTDFGAPTRPVAFGGRGEFDGMMTGPFRRPRVEGVFTGQDLRAWDTVWGSGSGRIDVQNSYITVSDGIVRRGDSEIRADGLFSLGYPRRDGGQQIDARFRVSRRDLDEIRHAFEIDDYPVSGLLSGEFHLTGEYERPVGFGAMTVEHGTAYDEPFDKGTASLRFDGDGVRLDSVSIVKGPGTLTGAAFVGWDGTYSFNAIGQRVRIEDIAAFSYPQIQPSGTIGFSAGGSGTFETPRYDVKFRTNDLSVVNEPVGQVTGTLAMRGNELNGEVDVTSSRLAITGTGRIALTPQADAELTFRFHESSLDPYVRLFVPKLSPYTTAVASGTLRVVGELADVDHLLVDGTVDSVEMRLFDYELRNGGPIKLALDQHVIRVDDLQLVGEDTRLRIGGVIGLHDQRIALQAVGDANLGILQGFFPNAVRGSGRAELMAAVNGPLFEPEFSGTATITNGRIRHFSMPNSLDAINGVVRFDSRGVGLDDVTATMGGGRVQFGGRIALDGYLPGDLNITARGEGLQLRVPEGVRSTVDADLAVRGNFKAPTIGGNVIVRNATWNRRIDPTGGLFDFGSSSGPGSAVATDTSGATPIPVRFDIEVLVPSTLRIENNMARLLVSADLQLRGTSERPLLFGRAEVDRGEILFEGRRYLVTRGAIEFNNPTRIEPFFDVETETRVRVPNQTYRVTVSFAGTTQSLQPQFSSDPPLASDTDVVALLFSDVRRDEGTAELRARQFPNERQTDILTSRATQLLASPLSSEVGRVVEQTFGVDTFQLTPSLFDPYSQTTATPRINPSARVTIGKRLSDRAYLTFSRSLSTSQNDQILLLEYDESDRLSWILSRNENQTYAVEVRVRHTF